MGESLMIRVVAYRECPDVLNPSLIRQIWLSSETKLWLDVLHIQHAFMGYCDLRGKRIGLVFRLYRRDFESGLSDRDGNLLEITPYDGHDFHDVRKRAVRRELHLPDDLDHLDEKCSAGIAAFIYS